MSGAYLILIRSNACRWTNNKQILIKRFKDIITFKSKDHPEHSFEKEMVQIKFKYVTKKRQPRLRLKFKPVEML